MTALQGSTLTISSPSELGRRLIGEFFFVHAAEAHTLSAPSQVGDTSVTTSRQEPTRRSYEFLHATFGEYLVASRVMDELVDAAETALGGRRGPREPEDDLLFALLSHQPLAVRSSILEFTSEIFANLNASEHSHVVELLEVLIASHRRRHGSDRYAAYRPLPLDRARELAAYSANLITLRVLLRNDEIVSLNQIFRESDDALREWQSTVMLWRAGLDSDGQQAMTAALTVDGNSVEFSRMAMAIYNADKDLQDVNFAQLMGDKRLEDRIRFGMAIRDQQYYVRMDDSDWANSNYSWVIPNIAGVQSEWALPAIGDASNFPVDDGSVAKIAKLFMRLIKTRGVSHDSEIRLITQLFEMPRVFEFDGYALAAAVIRNPQLAKEIPQLRESEAYGQAYSLLCVLGLDKELRITGMSSASNQALLAWLNEKDARGAPIRHEMLALIKNLLDSYAGVSSFEIVPLFPSDESE